MPLIDLISHPTNLSLFSDNRYLTKLSILAPHCIFLHDAYLSFTSILYYYGRMKESLQRKGIIMCTFEFPTDGIAYTKTELMIIDYIHQNLYHTLFLTIGQLAEVLHISEATISRFVRHAGYQDFKDLKNSIAAAIKQESPSEKLSVSMKKESTTTLSSYLNYQQFCMNKTLEFLDEEQLTQTLHHLLAAKKIYLYGKGAAQSLCSLFSFRLRRFGFEIVTLPSSGSEIYEHLVHITEDDFVLLFSFQKLSHEAKVLLEHRKVKHYKAALFTSRTYTQDKNIADYSLYVYRGTPSEYHSMAVPTALIDAMIIMIADLMGNTSVTQLEELHELKQKYPKDIPHA